VAATYLEESGEALAGVAFLIAVLAGVAPRVVLPATWGLRRSADAHTLELPEQLPTRTATDGRSLH
jgi:carbohydrate-binding DOMON domain-containing protein